MTGATLLRGGCVLTLDPAVGNHRSADVLLRDGRIADVGPSLRDRDATTIDATDTIVMPGFVDAHRHTSASLFRGLGRSAPLLEPDHFSPEDLYAATLVGLLGAAEAGITTVADWSLAPTAEHLDAVVGAHSDASLRTVLVARDVEPATPESTTLGFRSEDITRASAARLGESWAEPRRTGRRIFAHAGLDEADGGVLTELGDGVLDDDVTLIHGNRLTDGDLDAVAQAGCSIAISPSTEMAGTLGNSPIQPMRDRGITIGLGVDDEHIAPGDLLNQMRAAISLQHAMYFDLKLAGKAGLPDLLSTRELISMATAGGARVLGIEDRVGTLTPGKQADVLVLRTDRPNIYPINDPIGAVVWGMDTSNIDWVFVAGRPLVEDGRLSADLDHVRRLALAARDRVARAAGIDPAPAVRS